MTQEHKLILYQIYGVTTVYLASNLPTGDNNINGTFLGLSTTSVKRLTLRTDLCRILLGIVTFYVYTETCFKDICICIVIPQVSVAGERMASQFNTDLILVTTHLDCCLLVL